MLFFELAIEDLRRAADLFAPIHHRTAGVDGWVSLEVSPLLAYDAARSVRAAAELHARAGRENVFIKIPGTEPGLAAIEEATFAGVPINVTLLFSREQYLASADAYMRGIERRLEAGLDLNVPSVASVFISRWDAAVIGRVPDDLRGRLGLAVGLKTYQAYRRVDGLRPLATTRERRRACAAAVVGQHQHQGPRLPRHDVHRRSARAAHDQHDAGSRRCTPSPDHGQVGEPIAADGGDAEATLAQFEAAGIDVEVLAATLQSDGAQSFVESWEDLLSRIDDQVAAVAA